MYESVILRTVARVMMPLLLLLSVFMLLRGHNLPGGGFIGGLLASAAIIMQIIAFGPTFARKVIRVGYLNMAAFGVFFGALWGLPALFFNLPYMDAFWINDPIPGIGKIGTPVLFDVGVFLAVIGVTTRVALLLAEEPELFPMYVQAETEE
ncbi:Na+/H+ antiporter subunit B [Candidatus Chloroploca sp. M-50]|uniref:Na+/H+ antiporter subunit B n=1 Tax=Candidatus Chloroploca mongolica TaxID=2528176 RepID=A0ABS4DFZ3_9CHLR|nr:Na+/H+ antiporter subunit B [Candidatus Chloroploca mongolica]MBP1468366.1 Na+/H+ antiporter subunit B [Candidatus Chloroploca mongolica]NCC34483.1 Na+/H+ antiporter subunit B [Chloroflexia bacterium]